MVELHDFLEQISQREKLGGIGIMTSTWGKSEFHSSGSFSNDGRDITNDTKFPLNHLFDIFTSIYFTFLLDDSYIHLRDPLVSILKYLNIKEEISSLVYLQPNHLLSHSSGLAKWRNNRDILRGRESQYSTKKGGMLPLRQYFNQPIVVLEKPGNVFVHNPMDYALIALVIEEIKKGEYSELITEFLQQYVENVHPFDFDFEPGFAGKKGTKQTKKQFFHLYPSTMASMSFEQFAKLFHILAFENIDNDYISYYLFDAHVKTELGLDKIGYPLRFREDIGLYQLQSHGHGYSVSLLVNPSERYFSLVVINQDSKRSYRTLGEIQRYVLQHHQPALSLSLDGLDISPTRSQTEVICDNYKIFKQPALLNSLLFDDLGGTFSIEPGHGSFMMRGRNFGTFKSTSRYAKRFDLRILEQTGQKLILGYNDGFYYSKIIVPNASKGGIIYLELDHGPVLLRVDRPNDLLLRDRVWYRSILVNFGYIVFFNLLPIVRSMVGNFGAFIHGLLPIGKSSGITSPLTVKPADESTIIDKNDEKSLMTEQSELHLIYRMNDKIVDIIIWFVDHIYNFVASTHLLLKPFWDHFKIQISKIFVSIRRLGVIIKEKLVVFLHQFIVRITELRQDVAKSNSLYPPKLTVNRSGLHNLMKFSKIRITTFLSTTRFYPYLKKFHQDSNQLVMRIKKSIAKV